MYSGIFASYDLMIVIFCVHFHRAYHQEKLNVTTNGNNGANETEHLDLNFYLGIYAGNLICMFVCLKNYLLSGLS